MLNLPTITEAQARALIANGLAGYWELSLRDSISKSPIPHALQTCVFLAGHWYLVPVPTFKVTSLGRVALSERGEASAAMATVECNHDEMTALIKQEAARIGRPL